MCNDASKCLKESLVRRGVDVDAVKEAVKGFFIETPSWAYADSGTRFKVFRQKGAAKNVFHKIEDAVFVHRLTGVTPSVAVHVLWDFDGVSPSEVVEYAESRGVRIGAVNPTLFERDEYKFGSLASPDEAARQKALAHVEESVELMRACGSKVLSLWMADGTNYPGQDDLRERKHRMGESLKKIHDMLDEDMTMLIEYKLFEPAFYSTDIADWGMAYVFAKGAGERAKVLVDLGHHAHGVNIEQITAFLIDEDMLGGFHFNNRKYADDDLTVGSIHPYELFLIFNELVAAGGGRPFGCAYMIDQSHNIKPKIEAMIQSVMFLQEVCLKALVVDRNALAECRSRMDVVGAENVLRDAFFTDVRPLLEEIREEMGVPPDPLSAYRESGYQQKVEEERG